MLVRIRPEVLDGFSRFGTLFFLLFSSLDNSYSLLQSWSSDSVSLALELKLDCLVSSLPSISSTRSYIYTTLHVIRRHHTTLLLYDVLQRRVASNQVEHYQQESWYILRSDHSIVASPIYHTLA